MDLGLFQMMDVRLKENLETVLRGAIAKKKKYVNVDAFSAMTTSFAASVAFNVLMGLPPRL